MKKQNHILTRTAAALLITTGLSLTPTLHAQNTANADAMYNGYLNTYLYNANGQTYPTTSITNRSNMGGWGEAYVIGGLEDAYNRDKDGTRQALISQLLNTYVTVNFTNQNSTNMSWDSYNDDIAWGTLALARGFQITHNQTYLTDAENVWNLGWSRGWDSTVGGGIWETSPVSANSNDSKCTLSNLSFVPSGIILYQATGNTTYLNESEQIYAWVRSHLFNTSTGQVNECVHPTYTDTDTNVYNSGLLVNAAAYLYRITGNTQYYNDALLAANFQIKLHPIMNVDYPQNGPFGGDQYFRGLSNFARWNDLWSTYSTWFENNGNDAWNNRDAARNIAWNTITSPTPTNSDILSMESLSPMVLQQVSQIQAIAQPFNFSGNYEFVNARSNMALTVSNGSTSKGTAVVQEPYTRASDQLWTLTATSGGYYHIKNAGSGLALNVSGNAVDSFQEGAAVIQWPSQPMGGEDNDEWMPVHNSNGTYTFYNLNSEQVLDNFGASTASGNKFDQWVANGTAGQNFTLVSH